MSPKAIIILAVFCAGFSGCSEGTGRIGMANPALHFESAEGRTESINALRAAWRERPGGTSEGNRRAELRFLKGLGGFLARIKGTVEFTSACEVWNECVRDHTRQYGEIDQGAH